MRSKQFGNWAWLFLSRCLVRMRVRGQAITLSFFGGAQILSPHELVLISSVINALSFAFEYLLGTCFQVYLLLTLRLGAASTFGAGELFILPFAGWIRAQMGRGDYSCNVCSSTFRSSLMDRRRSAS
jgi:hypothetical protein